MTEIETMYNRVRDVAQEIDSAVALYGQENENGASFGRDGKTPQVIELEFGGPVDETRRVDFLQLVNGTGWEFVDEDGVFDGPNDGHGLVSFSRDVVPESGLFSDGFDQQEKF